MKRENWFANLNLIHNVDGPGNTVLVFVLLAMVERTRDEETIEKAFTCDQMQIFCHHHQYFCETFENQR